MKEAKFKIGDIVYSDFDITGIFKEYKIINVKYSNNCQSGILYQITPNMRNQSTNPWYDEGWFKK